MAALSSVSFGKHPVLYTNRGGGDTYTHIHTQKLVLGGCEISVKSSSPFDYVLSSESFGG